MQQQNTIKIEENGSITLQDVNNSTVTINISDVNDINTKLGSLNNAQLNAMQQVAEKEVEKVGHRFKELLKNIVLQKNIVGDISSVGGNVRIGDSKTTIYNYYTTPKPTLPKDLTVKIPKISQEKIVGRDSELGDLNERLFNSKQVVLVNGLGGIGKTTLAQAYTGIYYNKYRHIAWVSQVSDNFINDFVNTNGLFISLWIESDGKELNALFNEIIVKLKSIDDKPNLLIIDNADASLAQYYDLLPSHPNWHILVTSREEIQKFDLKQLDFLTEPEAINLFFKHYTRGKISREAITDLVRMVDKHTLTVEILAKTAQKQRIPIDRLKKAIEDDLKANVYVAHKGSEIERLTSYLCSIFTLSNLSENETWLMNQLACLPPEFHSYEDLQKWINPEQSQREEIFSETVEELTAKGWLLQNKEADQYKMHCIIADIIARQLPIELEDVSHLIGTFTEKLLIDPNKDNPVDKFQWIPFGKALLFRFSRETSNQIAVLQNNLATVLQDLGDYQGAKNLLEKAMISDEKNFGADHPSTAVRYSNLALVLKDLGDYQGAKNLLEKAMISAEKNFGADHPSTAVSYSNLATVLKDLGDYQQALKLSGKALVVFKQALPEEHPTITTVNEINEELKRKVST